MLNQEVTTEFLNARLKNEKKSYLVIKRFIDILISTSGLIILSPLMIVIMLLIKIEDSKAPIFFKQIRCGENGKEFQLYKFRSMQVDAEEKLHQLKNQNEQSGPVFKIKNDPRVTKIGYFIRRTSLDELPQLINVLKGEMSLVGPRPPLPIEVEQYNNYHKLRLLAKPGLTCIWQVSGRNSIGFEEWVTLDIQYLMTRTLWLDLKLIFLTIPALFWDKNAS